jgi:hypothetical protein
MLEILLSQESLELASDEGKSTSGGIAVERNCPEVVSMLLRHPAVDRDEEDEDVPFSHLERCLPFESLGLWDTS